MSSSQAKREGDQMAGLDRKVKAQRRQTMQAEKRAAKAAKKRERKAPR
jgi:hypothetical protein